MNFFKSIKNLFFLNKKKALGPIYEKNHIAIPLECVFSPIRDIFYRQELNKVKISNDKWLCKYCNKTFYSEYYLDMHFGNRHNDTLLKVRRRRFELYLEDKIFVSF